MFCSEHGLSTDTYADDELLKVEYLVYMFVVSEDISAWSGPFYSAPDALPYSLECNLDRTRLLKYSLARHEFIRVQIAEPV